MSKTQREFVSTTASNPLWHVRDAGAIAAVCGTLRALIVRANASDAARAKLLRHYTSGASVRISSGVLKGALEPCLRCEGKLRGVKVSVFVDEALTHRDAR